MGSLAVALLAVSAAVWPHWGAWWLTEDGPIEQASVLLWLGCAVALWRHRFARVHKFALIGFFIALSVREAGLPTWLVPSGRALMRASHYVGPDSVAPLRAGLELAMLVIVVFCIARALWHFVAFARHWRLWRQTDVRRALMAVVVMAMAQLADEGKALWWLTLFEETCEALGAALMLGAVLASYRLATGPAGPRRTLFPHEPPAR